MIMIRSQSFCFFLIMKARVRDRRHVYMASKNATFENFPRLDPINSFFFFLVFLITTCHNRNWDIERSSI